MYPHLLCCVCCASVHRPHAADVLQTVHAIVTLGGLLPHYVDPLTHLAVYVAAAGHDYGHKGLNNE